MNQKTRKSLGLCLACDLPRGEGLYCGEHSRQRKDAVLAKQHGRRASGKCRYCDEAPLEGKTICQEHNERKKRNAKALSDERALLGICRACKDFVVVGKKMCQKHLDYHKELGQRKIKDPQRQEDRRKRKEQGLCSDCKEMAVPGTCHCQRHLDYYKSHEMKQYRKEYKEGKGRYKKSKAHARCIGQEFTLTQEEFETLVAQPCTYCGFPHKSGGKGLDRLNNSRGYIPGNVVSCCYECNVARSDNFVPDEMKTFLGPAIREVKISRAHEEASAFDAERTSFAEGMNPFPSMRFA